ncbi:FAD binding domain-containing protein [Cladophialophora immunda]|nr:FAD binding domain-containing protein [Cladophialophora immunda]
MLEEMRSQYVGWDPCLRRLLEMVISTLDWPIYCIDIPDTWSSRSGKVLITGDAAHAMVPYMALGAAMAVEDAAALAATLKHVKATEDLPSAISKWEETRKPRVKRVHEASYAHGLILHLPDGPVQEARDEAMKAELQDAEVKESPNQWSDPVLTEWAYGHDPEAEIDRLWSVVDGQS